MWDRATPAQGPAREVTAGPASGGGGRDATVADAWLAALQDVAVFELDHRGRIRTWTEAARRTLSYEAGEVVGRHVACLHTAAAVGEGVSAQWLRAAHEDGRADIKGWCVRRDGSVFLAHMVAVAHGDGVAVACHDITVRYAAEERAAQAEVRQRLMADILHDHAICELSLDGQIRDWNAGAEALTGFSAADAVGRPLWVLYPHPQAGGGERAVLAALDEVRAHGRWRGEERLQCKDGRLVRCHIEQVLIRDAAACPIGILWTARSGSAAARLEELESAGRRVQAFLAILAHELRNPLAPIRNAVDVIRLSAPADDRIRHCADIVGRQAQLLTRLVSDLMDVGRVTTGKLKIQPVPTMFNEIVSASIEAMRPTLEAAGQRLAVTLPPDPVFVNADAGRLGQVLSNLLSNAAKYTPRGGAITVTVNTDGGNVVTMVSDSGEGIAPDALDRIFHLFAQEGDGDGQRGGLGIGLALARAVVEAHGGAIQATSPGLGRGSTFTMILPEVEMDGEAVERAPTKALPVRRVLIVDDNADSADSMVELLAVLGHEARAAYGGAQALAIVRDFPPDVVLLDLEMPEVGGYEVLAGMRAQGITARVLALTGRGTADDRRRALDAGFEDHLVKPVTVEILCAALGANDGAAGTASPAADPASGTRHCAR
ncbi:MULTISPECIES: hybrid sensor histidine kinase/response regulator [unclassified Cupriavidus]|uniref:hybrid sensor histidine kinase/response regulator n=1 Tax=Cupriavidus sp. H19C3 TaxID=3241603 RepID=UPI003BF8DD2D